MKKKLIILVTVCFMCISLIGCGSGIKTVANEGVEKYTESAPEEHYGEELFTQSSEEGSIYLDHDSSDTCDDCNFVLDILGRIVRACLMFFYKIYKVIFAGEPITKAINDVIEVLCTPMKC